MCVTVTTYTHTQHTNVRIDTTYLRIMHIHTAGISTGMFTRVVGDPKWDRSSLAIHGFYLTIYCKDQFIWAKSKNIDFTSNVDGDVGQVLAVPQNMTDQISDEPTSMIPMEGFHEQNIDLQPIYFPINMNGSWVNIWDIWGPPKLFLFCRGDAGDDRRKEFSFSSFKKMAILGDHI